MACAPDRPPEAAAQTARALSQGPVIGFLADNGASVWMGIPYAASTAGHNRWRAPKPAPGWTETLQATTPAPRCIQLTNEYDEDEGLEAGQVVGSEDCLTLDIYAPGDTGTDALPVVIWIHGGGNVWGRSSSYDGSRLASNERLIVVAVQYRLGPFGWFAHPAIRASAEHPHDAAASFATLDLIASLRWVRDNIAVFGGDPARVTIAGESHGGYNVMTLLASPLAKGLFHRAILQSGGFDSMSIAEAQGDVGDRKNNSKQIVQRLGVHSAEALRDTAASDLLNALTRGTGFVDAPRVIEDGVALPAHRLRQSFTSKATFNAVPMLMGTNLHEMKLFYARDERFINAKWGIFPVPADPELWDLFTEYLTRLWRIRAIDEPARSMAEAKHDPVYSYRFDWDDGGSFLSINMQTLFGASHGFEIPFVFNRFEHLGPDADRILFEPETEQERQTLSRIMGSYWGSFIRSGAPAVSGQPEWPAYASDGGTFLRLDTDSSGGIEAITTSANSLNKLLKELNADARINQKTRCLIVSEMQRWMYSVDIEDQLQRATGCAAQQ